VTLSTLVRLLGVYAGALFVASIVLAGMLGADRLGESPRSIVSVWAQGKRRARVAVSNDPGSKVTVDTALLRETRQYRGTRTVEEIIDASPVLSTHPVLFGASFVAAEDGIEAQYGDKTAYATVDDLIAWKAYDRAIVIGPIRLQLGVDPDIVLNGFARELDVPRQSLLDYGAFRRLTMRRSIPPEPEGKVTVDTLRDSAVSAGRYLAGAVHQDGTYRYEVNAITNEDSEGYNWPRHSGATWFLAESAIYSREPLQIDAVQRAAKRLAEGALVDCGEHRCIAEGERADLGSSALGLLALVEIVEGGLMPELMPVIRQLTEFIRSQQRPDGEFKHFYDREKREPIDQQVLYYTGEASFALGRAARLTKDPRDLDAAKRSLERLVDFPPWYLAWHYFWGAEHWTCHAMGELWERAPNPKAMSFCLEWQESVRNMAIWQREASPGYDGATSAGPFVPPAFVGTATRMEAAVSTLRAARLADVSPAEVERLEAGIRQSLSFLLRYQLNPGPTHLMPQPALMRGAFASTPTDFKVRIDYPQHAGTAIIKYLKLLEQQEKLDKR
jgi:hypothetical protein